MPRISADQRIPALMEAVRSGRLPPRPVPGRPPTGLGAELGPTGLLVTGGPRTWRLGGAAGTRLGEVLAGRPAEAREAELLHALGLWEQDDALPAGAAYGSSDAAAQDARPLTAAAHGAAAQDAMALGSAAQDATALGSAAQDATALNAATQGAAALDSAAQDAATLDSAAQDAATLGATARDAAAQDATAQGAATLGSALRFCGRWAATTRRHSGGAAVVAAWRRVRPVVVGDSALARELARELAWSWPATAGARELLLVVDRAPDPAETRPQLPVCARGGTVTVGPWTEPGETPCPACVAQRPPATGPVTGDLGLLAALAVAEAVHTVAGIGRGARPGLVVEHSPASGTTRAHGLGPAPDCTRCAGRPARPDRARTAAESLPAVLLAAAPPRRWRAPAAEEVHFTQAAIGLQHAVLPGEPLTADLAGFPAEPRWTEFLVRVAGRRSADSAVDRWAPSAGNLGAGTLIAPGRDGALLLQPRHASDDPAALQAVHLTGGPPAGGFGLAVDVARLVGKYGDSGRRIAAAEAGALLAQTVTAAAAAGLRARLSDAGLSDARLPDGRLPDGRLPDGRLPELPPGFVPFGSIEVTPGHRRSLLAEAGLRARRSRRDLGWQPAGRGSLTLALRRARGRARAAGIDTSGIRLTLLAPGTAGDVLMQPGLPGRAALLLAHTDLTLRGDPGALRDAAALLALVALAGGAAGLHSCLVHGIVPVAAAARLGGGLIDRAALIGLLVGHETGEGHA
ncbi:hypothetical protein [Streptomyces sp. NBC_00503]|uniref:hypothetical protein n=1 Tax=Streptomyces sp. NBC_00503 TaxID=2903659 RepID=UPI002E7FF41C|nr:hypothetical protein [Streptomyces sp. NBC_00503]WUD82546.1 hypothetical protein OG490_19475 [Streptomyces sp. NBC_00503]